MAKKLNGKTRGKMYRRELRIAQRAMTNKTRERRDPSEEIEAILALKTGLGE